MANPNVAVVVGFLQIEGVASVKGHPLDEGNADYIKAFKENQPEKYESYTKNYQTPNRDLAVIKIEPKRIAQYKYADPSAGIEEGVYILNVAKGKAHRIIDVRSLESNPRDAPACARAPYFRATFHRTVIRTCQADERSIRIDRSTSCASARYACMCLRSNSSGFAVDPVSVAGVEGV